MTWCLSLEKKKKILCCFNVRHEAGVWKKELSCCIRAMTDKKFTKKRDACAKLLFFLINLLLFLPFLLLSSLSLLKLPIVVIQKFCCHGYVLLLLLFIYLFFLIYFFGYVLAVFCWRKFLVSCCSQWNEREQEAEGLLWLHQLNRSNR